VARDDEFRKVAEDMRALARSLAKDFRDAVDQSRLGGETTGRALRDGIRGMANEAGRGMRSEWRHARRSFGPGYGPGCGRWGPPWGPGPPPAGPGSPPGGPAGRPGPGPGGPPWAGYQWGGPPWASRRHGPPRSRQPRSPLPPVRRHWDATVVIGLLVVLFGVGWLLGEIHAFHVSLEAVLAMGLLVLGASLIVTGRTDWSLSRRSWPVWLGAGLVVALLATSATFGVGNALQDVSFGNKAATATGNGGSFHGGFGNLTVDARNVRPGATIKAGSVAGNMVIDVPLNATIDVRAHVLGGQICVYGQDEGNGVSASVNQTFKPASAGPGANSGAPITVDVHEVFGQIMIGGSHCGRPGR
jgi:hypothetical protein